ncbi:MAG TPA: hypothetical protein EYG57_14280 [Planctomycetes bacterium]|nr:hypothetical protein [Planctomycetaceae bacterium]HIM30698.1 hypothetical protein [Planctomycetota bacterium]
MNRYWFLFYGLVVVQPCVAEETSGTLRESLQRSPNRLVFETYNVDNWDLAIIDADGTNRVNITNSKKQHELYPQASPDGTKICFIVDRGIGRDTVRSVWVMDIDGKNRKKVADNARQPFWAPDSKTIAYLPQEFPRFNIADYFSTGLVFYDLESSKTRKHPNSQQLHHLYNPNFASNGKWIAATVHAGMGYGHTNLLVEANGSRIINLGDQAPDGLAKSSKGKRSFGGCRPCISPDNKMIAWGRTDHEICVAELDLDEGHPKVGNVLTRIRDPKNKIYHVDWAPDGQFLSLSRGPISKGDLSKPGTHEAACEMVGIYAKGWDIVVVVAADLPVIDLDRPNPAESYQVTKDGASNKESDWFRPAK